MIYTRIFQEGIPLLLQLNEKGLEFDQLLSRALEISASKPDISREDTGFPDSYLTLALYRLNSILTRIVYLDDQRFNLFHEYKLAPPCAPSDVIPGHRLCRVLDAARSLAEPENVIGVGHFLRAIVTLSLDEPAWEYMGGTFHNTFSVETLLWGLGHSAWTSLQEAPEVVGILETLSAREPINDQQYMLTAERGRIIFRPISILDPYRMADKAHPRNRLGVLTHFSDGYSTFRPTHIMELEDLINNQRTKESDLQSFFERNPNLMRLWEYRDVYPEVYLTREEDGDLIPDFILVDPDLQKAMIIDLKLPQQRIVVGTKNRRRLSAPVQEARSQLLRYRDWFEESHNRTNIKERFGMQIYRPRLGVIIGRGDEFVSEFERQQIVSDNKDIEIVTYDDVVELAKRRLMLIQRAPR